MAYDKELELSRVFQACVSDPDEYLNLFYAHMYDGGVSSAADMGAFATVLREMQPHAGKATPKLVQPFAKALEKVGSFTRGGLKKDAARWHKLFSELPAGAYTDKTAEWCSQYGPAETPEI